MKLSTAWIITKKELKESLRDRRTLFLMVALPILLYPALLLLVSQATSVQMEQLEEQPSAVALVGAAADHPLRAALDDAEMIALVELRQGESALEGSGAHIGDPFAHRVDLIIDARSWPSVPSITETFPLSLHFQSVSEESRQAMDRVEAVLTEITQTELTRRLLMEGLSESFVEPIQPQLVNHSSDQQQGGYLLGAILPLFVIVTVLIGAYYPAIDLTAGEKERGSIQTLFTAPIAASEIVAGKYIAVVCIAMISGFANLVSIVLVMGQGLRLAGDLASEFDLGLSIPLVLALLWNIFLISLLFSAILLAVAVLARSFKEAQTYITPVYLLCLVPGVLAQLPGVEYSTVLGTIPGVGAVVLMKSLLLDGVSAGPMITTSIASLLWTVLALLTAARLFGQESVIFGERASLSVFPKRAEITRSLVPTMGAGLAWGSVAFLLLFYVGATWQQSNPQVGLAGTLWIALLAPTVFVAWYGKVDLRHTFQLRAPSPRAVLATIVLGLSALWVVNGVNTLVELVMPTPDGMAEEMAEFLGTPDSALDWFLLVLLFSVSPAICEEAIFRGYLFTSLRDRVSPAVCVGATAIAFGAFHLSIYRFAGTAMLGVVMGVLVWRTRSIWTSALFHAINNGIAVALMFFAGADAVSADIEPTTVAATAVAGLVGCAIGFWLLWGVPTPPPPSNADREAI